MTSARFPAPYIELDIAAAAGPEPEKDPRLPGDRRKMVRGNPEGSDTTMTGFAGHGPA